MNYYDITSQLLKQISGESDAQKDYYEFLDEFHDKLESSDIEIIKGIISDELSHTEKVLAMIKKYSELHSTSDEEKRTVPNLY